MGQRRVVITGLGLINALGIGKQQYFEGLVEGRVGIDRIRAFDAGGFPSQIGGEAPRVKMAGIVPKAHRKATKLMSRDIELAVVAADCAVRDAKLKTKGTCDEGDVVEIDPTRCGVNVGAGLICCDLLELGAAAEGAVEAGRFSYRKWGGEGMESLTPLWLLKYLPNMLSCHISIIHDLQGPNNSITCAEVSGLLAIGEAFRTIAHDRADVMIAGGAECKVNPMALLRQCLLGRVSTHYNDCPQEACRPFDMDADGTVVGEGGGIIVLEELEHARRRGAPIYAELRGFGASNNFSEDFVQPEPEGTGIAMALRKALQEAKLSAEQIQVLIPHGLGLRSHDEAEANGIKASLGGRSESLPVLATKSRIGNCGAGAAAIDVITAVLAMQANKIPANLNCPKQGSDYGLNVANDKGIEIEIENAVTCCYTFGGQTAAVVISRVI